MSRAADTETAQTHSSVQRLDFRAIVNTVTPFFVQIRRYELPMLFADRSSSAWPQLRLGQLFYVELTAFVLIQSVEFR